jgi:hypothetical protein
MGGDLVCLHVGKPEPTPECSADTMGENTPKLGFFSSFHIRTPARNPRNITIFCSCGKYTRISFCLPKYGRFRPLPMATKGPRIDAVFATLFTPSGTRKGRKNANMRIFFSEGGSKNEVLR